MSRESEALARVQDDQMKLVVRKAFDVGFKAHGFGTKPQLYWEPTKRAVSYSASKQSDHRAYRNLAKLLEQVSGKTILPKVKTGKIRKGKDVVEGYAGTEIDHWAIKKQEFVQGKIEVLAKEHKKLTLTFFILTQLTHPQYPTPEEITMARLTVRRISAIEEIFEEVRFPIPDFSISSYGLLESDR